MVKKGKKLWRSIDVSQIEDTLEKDARAQRHGQKVDEIPDSELFVIDKEQDEAAVASRTLPGKRKKELKPLRCQIIINAAHKAKPVNAGSSKPKVRGRAVKRDKEKQKGRELSKQTANKSDELDLWGSQHEQVEKSAKRLRCNLGLPFKAVEIDAPGCSYNPDPEHHQDAVAEAVAAEMTKQYAEEMLPKPVKVPRLPQADELEELLVDADPDEEDEEEEEKSGDGDGPIVGVTAFKRVPEKKTRTQRNREKRRREAEAAVGAKKSLKKQRRDLDCLKLLQRDIEQDETERTARAARRAADREEAARQGPPRLGRHKFEPAPLQVLLSEEVGGGLLKLKGTAMLATERFKSLQKRGIIEARPKVRTRQKRRKRAEFTPGESSEKLKAAHEETLHFLKAGAKMRAAADATKKQK